MLWKILRAQRVKLEGYKAIILGKMSKDEEGYNRFTEAKASVKFEISVETPEGVSKLK